MQANENYSRQPIGDSELILNADGSLYHLGVVPGQIAPFVLIVGDPERVESISSRFDAVEVKVRNREFCIHTGRVGKKRISVVSTGIGVDNIDIVMNELDACVNIDLESRKVKEELTSLQMVRIGTSGAMHEDMPVGGHVVSEYAFGFDGVPYSYEMHFDDAELELQTEFLKQVKWPKHRAKPYFVAADETLVNKLKDRAFTGITATANGFYGPQNRQLRLPLSNPNQTEQYRKFDYKGLRITNYEMETAGLYALGAALGHKMCTKCVILANRYRKEFSKNPKQITETLIDDVLARF
ncbi:nucleoside phosphorylase [Halocola ammonii]